MVFRPSDLDLLECVVLGVLSVGLPPSKSAGDDRFRIDHVVAVSTSLSEGLGETAYLGQDGVRVDDEFRARLRSSIGVLVDKGLVTAQAPGMPAAAGSFDPSLAIDVVNPDEHPVVLDRNLSQGCLETLLQDKRVYGYLMDRYAKSGEVWRRLRDEGYAS